MLTIEDLNRIINIPSISLDINQGKVKDVIDFRDEAIPFVDNSNIFTVDFINKLNGILSYWYMLQNNPWIKEKCVVGLMGAYNAGKSTLLNYLLGTDLPTGINPVTAVATYIAYGAENKHYIVDNEGNLKLLPEDLKSRLSHEETKGFNLRKIISHTVLYNQSQLLKKISFLDTPGITADNEYDYATTADAAGKCDIVLWAVRIKAGAITEFEINFIKKFLEGKKLYVVITHADKSPSPEKVRQTVLKQLADANIECVDSFFFGERTTRLIDVKEQLDHISEVLQKESAHFQTYQPQEQLNKYMAIVQTNLEKRINEVTGEKQRIGTQCRQYENHVGNIKASLSSNTEALRRSINNLRDTINDRCRVVRWCTGGSDGTYTQLLNHHNSMVHNYNSLYSSISELDIEQLVQYGKTVSYLSRLTDELDNLVASRNKCVELIKKSKNLLK